MHRLSVISHDGRWLATRFGSWYKWPETFLINTEDSSEKVLTDSHSREWENLNFIKPELFKFKNRHGDTISAMIFKPFSWKPGDKRPGIVYVYGGPLGTSHTVESDSSSTLSYMFQMIMAAKHGYVSINIDPRGMTGYGRKFSEANFEKVGKAQVEDLEDLIKHIKTGFGVDVEKVGLHGWSFGGFQTLKTLLTSPATFACGIATASVTEWENYYASYTGFVIAKLERGKPHMRKYSLIPSAKNLKKPLLLIHGMQDANVLFQDTVNIYNALLKAGKETLVELFLDPEGGHGLRGAVPSKSVFKKYESWFLRHLGKGSGSPLKK
jgi:dipeptidyl aminopeptidase/acylaminoacyl peptidase